MPVEDRLRLLRSLGPLQAEHRFLELASGAQADLLVRMTPEEQRVCMRVLAPDDAADVLQEVPEEDREVLVGMLDDRTRSEVNALLAYAEDQAGGLMSPRFARVRPDMTVDEAIRYLRKQSQQAETIYTVYVLDSEQRLLGVCSLRELFAEAEGQLVRDIMHPNPVFVRDDTDQEEVSRLCALLDLIALPVVDSEGRMQGIVTVDDIVDVVQEEATEDIQKLGGMEALDAPYLEVGFLHMLQKRAGWLTALFLGEMLTATAMGYYQAEIEKAVMLALFVPLIISSGGNSGSQATTLVIRAMALGEVRIRDWFKVMSRELAAGLGLGIVLGSVGICRILLWQYLFGTYHQYYLPIALTVGCSLVGVVMFGTLAGSMLPFVLRGLGFDPASASAPFVATLVDVMGLIIYFTVAGLILHGILL